MTDAIIIYYVIGVFLIGALIVIYPQIAARLMRAIFLLEGLANVFKWVYVKMFTKKEVTGKKYSPKAPNAPNLSSNQPKKVVKV